MLWNEWHACANSRGPDISKVSDRAVYTVVFPLRLPMCLPRQRLKDPLPLRRQWGGQGGAEEEGKIPSKVIIGLFLFFAFFFLHFFFHPNCPVIVCRLLVLCKFLLFFLIIVL